MSDLSVTKSVWWRLLVGALLARDAAAKEPVSFSKQVAPILLKQCQTCHGAKKSKGKYRLDTFEQLLKAGSSDAKPVVAGDAAASELYKLIAETDPDLRMPQDADALSKGQVELIRRWIDEGATFDGPDATAPLVRITPAEPHPAAPKVYSRPTPLTALALRPDGAELAAAGYNEVTIWDPKTGKLLRRIGNIAQRTHAIIYVGEDSTRLAVAGGVPGELGEVKIFDAVSGDPVHTLLRTTDMVLALALSPDGKQLATAGADQVVRVYKVDDGKLLLETRKHADWVTGVAFSPNGKQLVTASRDKTAKILNLSDGEVKITYQDHRSPVYDAAFSADGKLAITGGADNRIHVWKVSDAKKVGDVRLGGDVFRLLIDGERFFSGSQDRTARLFSTNDRKTLHTFEGHSDQVYSLSYAKMPQLLATGAYDGQVRVWSVRDQKTIQAFYAAPGYEQATKK